MSKRIVCVDVKDNKVCFYDNNDQLFVLDIDNEMLEGKTFPCHIVGRNMKSRILCRLGAKSYARPVMTLHSTINARNAGRFSRRTRWLTLTGDISASPVTTVIILPAITVVLFFQNQKPSM